MLILAAQLERDTNLQSFFEFLSGCIGTETDGASMGVAMCDKLSGALTLNLGMVNVSGGVADAVIDIRFPVTADGSQITAALAAKAASFGVSSETLRLKPPLYVPADSELVTRLMHVHGMFRSDPCIPRATGGGTYARIMGGHCVAFCGMGENEHQPNERVAVDEFMECAKVYAQALFNLAIRQA